MIKNKLIKFGAVWCNPCKQASKFLSENFTSDQYEDVDVAENETLARHFGIRNVPTFVLVNCNGDEIERFVGFDPQKIKQSIEKLK